MGERERQLRIFPEDVSLRDETFPDSRYSEIPKKQIVEGHICASKSEASVARALIHFCGWEIREGETFQCSIGNGKTVDFLLEHDELGPLFVEWHPINKHWEMDKRTHQHYKKVISQYGVEERKEIAEMVDMILLDGYHARRQEAIKCAPIEEYRGIPLLILTHEIMLYRYVIVPRAVEGIHIPNETEFCRQFKKQRFH